MNKHEEMLVKNGLLTIEDTAEMLNKSVTTINNWIYARKRAPAGFPMALSVFGKRFFLLSAVNAFIEKSLMVEMMKIERVSEAKRKVGRPKKMTTLV